MVSAETFGVARKSSLGDVVDVAGGCLTDGRRELGVATHEPGPEALEKAEHVGADKDLAVAPGPRTDSDRRDGELSGDFRGHLGWHAFENDREGPGFFHGRGV